MGLLAHNDSEPVTAWAEQQIGFWHVARKAGPQVLRRIQALQPGQKMHELPEELWHRSLLYYVKEDPTRRGGPNLRMIRLDPDMPSLTVTGFIFNKFVHPTEDRFITVREAARLQDFPDDFLFSGTLTGVQQQVGNAVPARLALAAARIVMSHAVQHGVFEAYDDGSGMLPALSLFTGVGGLDLGFDRLLQNEVGSSFKPVACIEYDSACCATLRLNGIADAQPIDITTIESPKQYLKAAGVSHVPLVIGGPPCQSFSQAGRQRADRDDRGLLVFDFARFVAELQPEYFVMENVRNLLGVSGGKVLRSLLSAFSAGGYHTQVHKLCATDFGTAQRRVRLLFLGTRRDLPTLPPPAPTHFKTSGGGGILMGLQPYRTVADAFEGLPTLA